MEDKLIPFNHFLLNKGTFDIPSRTKSLLYFSIERPQKVGCTASASISLEIKINDKSATTDEGLNEIIREEVVKLQKENVPYNDFWKHIKEKMTIEVDCGKSYSEEPSLIYLSLPIIKPAIPREVSNPGYYPCYALLTPEQKWIYLNWLQDISKPVRKGYVYVYYYGLERRLLQEDNFDAIDELLFLSEHHDFIKKDAYSAILFSYFRSSNEEILKKVFTNKLDLPINNLMLILYYSKNKSLSSKDIFELVSQYGSINKRYLNYHPQLYLQELDNYLLNRYAEQGFPFYKRDYYELPLERTKIFMNYSLPEEVREVEIYNIINNSKFVNDITNIHNVVHEKVKTRLKEEKKTK